VTVRFGEEELRKLDELAQRMGVTRSDVIRNLINRFEDALRQEVEKERKRWVTMGVVGALESIILGPGLILRFIRRNVDILGYPDFVVGMVRVRNRIVVFSHHDRIGSQLLNLVRSRIEEDVKREEAEIEQEDDGDEDSEGGRAAQIRIPASRPVRLNTIRVAPVATKYRIMISNRSGAHIPRLTAVATAGRPGSSGGSGGAKATAATTVPENKKLVAASQPNAGNPANSQTRGSNPQTNAGGSNPNPAGPVGQESMDRRGGDFIIALITQSYHKHRDKLLKLMESIAGD
jgi:predicted transcriptional regulator